MSDPVEVLREFFETLRVALSGNMREPTAREEQLPMLMQGILAKLESSLAREKRLEALVRELGKCRKCSGTGRVDVRVDVDELEERECQACVGTGLVEAARKEIESG